MSSLESRSNPLPSLLRIGENHASVFYFSISIALLAVVVAADAFTPFELGFSAFYVLPVLIASWGLGRSKGLGFALLAACCWYLADVSSGRWSADRRRSHWSTSRCPDIDASIPVARHA